MAPRLRRSSRSVVGFIKGGENRFDAGEVIGSRIRHA
jgi:hypothetical protein